MTGAVAVGRRAVSWYLLMPEIAVVEEQVRILHPVTIPWACATCPGQGTTPEREPRREVVR